jgi:hypothetical protein
VNNTALLGPPPTDTKRSPVVAPGGTVTVMDVSVELVGSAYTDGLKTTCGSCVPSAENPLPEIVSDEPTAPDDCDKVVMAGDGITVKPSPLLALPDTVTTTFPEVAPAGTITSKLVLLQDTQITGAPLSVTVLLACDVPNPEPLIATTVPTEPIAGFMTSILGAA